MLVLRVTLVYNWLKGMAAESSAALKIQRGERQRIMLQSVMSVSDALDIREAACEVVNDCRQRLGGLRPQVGLVFTSCMDGDYGAMLACIREAFPGIALLGCTTDGEISRSRGFSEDSVALLLLGGEGLSFGVSLARNLSRCPEEALGKAFAEATRKIAGVPRYGLLFPDGLTTIGVALDRVLWKVCGERFPFFGCSAGDHGVLRTTRQFFGAEVCVDAAPMLVLGGGIEAAVGVGGGWTPIGRYYPVCRVEANRLHEVGNWSAMAFFKKHLGLSRPGVTQVPLAVYRREGGHFRLRNAIAGDATDGSVAFSGTFPGKCAVRLTTVFRENLIAAATGANEAALSGLGGEPDLVLVFSGAGRRHILGTWADDELGGLARKRSLPFFGLYGYGEITPLSLGKSVTFQNDTYVAVGLRAVRR